MQTTKPKSYTLLQDRVIAGNTYGNAGDTVYALRQHDYGAAGDDTRGTGKEHRSVTLDPHGDYPFFTVPVADLQPSA